MRAVYKYPLDAPAVTLALPVGAEVLHVDSQRDRYGTGDIYLWALVDPDAPTEERRFLVRGTGHALPDGEEVRHLGSLKSDEAGSFIFHVWERL